MPLQIVAVFELPTAQMKQGIATRVGFRPVINFNDIIADCGVDVVEEPDILGGRISDFRFLVRFSQVSYRNSSWINHYLKD